MRAASKFDFLRNVNAHAALVPARKDFSPTPAMPEIAEAAALVRRLAEDCFGR
jgi:hypothetical protein